MNRKGFQQVVEPLSRTQAPQRCWSSSGHLLSTGQGVDNLNQHRLVYLQTGSIEPDSNLPAYYLVAVFHGGLEYDPY